MLDHTDLKILELLQVNCKMQYREIGEAVHLTGQAVANRIARLEALGVIKGYTVLLDDKLMGKAITAYVTVFMKTVNHSAFQMFIKNHALVAEANRISGEGCYLLKLQLHSEVELTHFLDAVLEYGNYRVNISIGSIK